MPALGESQAALSAVISSQQAKLLASDGEEFDTFGLSVAVSGDTAIIGASRDDGRGTDAGAAYIYVRSGVTWIEQAKLLAADGASNDSFGIAVALSGNTAIIGSMFADDGVSDGGSAYVFVRSGTTWTQQAKLLAADRAPDDQLGISVAIAGDTAIVGATNEDDLGDRAGASYVFVRSGAAWTEQTKLTAADGAEADQFGISVAVSGDTALVGAFGDDDLGRSSGSAYVFVRSAGSWTQQAKLLASDGNEIDELGVSVALAGDTALVGAVFADDEQGAAYVYVRSGTSWTEQAKLSAADGAPSDNFGNAVALEGDTALIGAPNDNDLGAASGSAYVFVRLGTGWSQDAKLLASDGTSIDLFGVSVGLSAGTAVIGALGDDDRGSSSGSTYVYVAPGEPTEPGGENGGVCVTSADCASGFCTDGVCCNAACGNGDANDCQACSVAAGAAVNGACGPRAPS
ncbi:MAG: FG-GAP repeat protein, partial [Myxococcales bacterium]|nr:FG-GAP repeat protein [Myxococcales bacterium]